MANPPAAGPPPPFPLGAGQTQPTPQQIAAFQQQFHAEAARQGLTPQQLAEKLRAHAMAQQQAAQQQQQGQGKSGAQSQGQGHGGQQQQAGTAQGGQQPQTVPMQPGPPKPEALAVAKFLKSQDLKSRPCVLQEKRKELFKGALFNLQLPTRSEGRIPPG